MGEERLPDRLDAWPPKIISTWLRNELVDSRALSEELAYWLHRMTGVGVVLDYIDPYEGPHYFNPARAGSEGSS